MRIGRIIAIVAASTLTPLVLWLAEGLGMAWLWARNMYAVGSSTEFLQAVLILGLSFLAAACVSALVIVVPAFLWLVRWGRVTIVASVGVGVVQGLVLAETYDVWSLQYHDQLWPWPQEVLAAAATALNLAVLCIAGTLVVCPAASRQPS